MIDDVTQTNEEDESAKIQNTAMSIAHIISPDSDESEEALRESFKTSKEGKKAQRTCSRTSSTTRKGKGKSKRRLKICSFEGCTSAIRAFNRCKKHGGLKECSMEGCNQKSQTRGLCIR